MRSKYFLLCMALSVVALLAATRSAAAENQDRVSFGSRIVITENETVDDVVCFLCSVEAHGKIQGDVVTFLGSVKTTSPIQGDVVTFAGNVILDDEAAIGGDLVVFGGHLRKSTSAHIDQDQVIFPEVIFFIPIVIVGAIIWAITLLFRRRVPVFYIPPVK